MNREILFRGKRVDTGDWVEGYYFKTPLTDGATGSKLEDGWYFLTGRKRHCISRGGCVYEVIPDTVSQYTGLKDKAGRMIFDGDILQCISRLDNANTVVIFEDGEFRMVLCEEYKSYIGGCGFFAIGCFTKKVIGNIHNNPELLAKSDS